MRAILGFLASMAGRVVRVVAGLALILVGLLAVGGAWGWVLAIVGLAVFAAGAFDFCIFAPLFGLPFMGPALRKALKK
jgi:Inner membrane protein YgaP-like, transmembrane domain